MIITNLTSKFTANGDFIIPADVLSDLGLDLGETLTLTHIMEQDDDPENSEIRTNHVMINHIYDDDEDLEDTDIFEQAICILEELDCLHQKVDTMIRTFIAPCKELDDKQEGDDSNDKKEIDL